MTRIGSSPTPQRMMKTARGGQGNLSFCFMHNGRAIIFDYSIRTEGFV